MLETDKGKILELDSETKAFVSHAPLPFRDTVELLTEINQTDQGWHLASIAEVESHERTLRSKIKEFHPDLVTIEVWVSDLLELETGNLNIPKFYSCDISLSKPKNGSISLRENKCMALFIQRSSDEK